MQPKPPSPSVVLDVPLKHGSPRKRSWLCGIDGGHAPRRITPRLIASHMSKRRGERSLSSSEPKPRPGTPPATTCPPAQTPVLFSTSLTVAGKKGSSREPEFPNSQSHKDTANIYASYFQSHFSQQTLRLSRGAKRSFMNDLRSDQCSDPIPSQHFLLTLHHQGTYNCYFQTLNLHCLRPRPHSLSSTNTSSPFSPETYPFSTGPGFHTPFPHTGNLPPLSPYTDPVNLPTLQPPIVQFLSLPVSHSLSA